jgi:hypothetical protein
MFLKPAACLQKGTFFRIFLLRDLDITTNCKPMLYTAVEVDLIWQLDIFQNDFSLMAFLGWEDCVGFYGWLVASAWVVRPAPQLSRQLFIKLKFATDSFTHQLH